MSTTIRHTASIHTEPTKEAMQAFLEDTRIPDDARVSIDQGRHVIQATWEEP